MRIIGLIPARFHSKRFPGKPLAKIGGKTLIRRVWERAKKAKSLSEVFVLTDDKRILEECRRFGAKAILTGKAPSGSHRAAEAAKNLKCDVIINIQGDEPFISPLLIDRVAKALKSPEVQVVTAKTKLKKNEYNNPNVVKVITDRNDFAIYFSRSPIPWGNFRLAGKHTGIYGYKREILLKFPHLKSDLCKAEDLEQLRFIENGIKMKVVKGNPTLAIDTPSDIKKAMEKLKSEKSV